jgi:succinate dehydrogenase / fumarate reductase iron-sulfur subunit
MQKWLCNAFISAKVSHLALLPQGRVEAKERVQKMVAAMTSLALVVAQTLVLVKLNAPKGFLFLTLQDLTENS